MIEFHHVSKKFTDGPFALNNVSFQIAKGEIVFLTGPSGAGKTTMLRMIYREDLPDTGDVLVTGKNVGKLSRREVPMLRRRLGIVFQDSRLIPRRTVFENVIFLPRILGFPREKQKKEVWDALRRVGLSHRMNAYPAHLSTGEQQRVALARALISDPPVLLADEPTGNVDPEQSDDIMELLLDANSRGTTVLMATHDQRLLAKYAARVLRLERGRLVADDRTAGKTEPPPRPDVPRMIIGR